jgi:hypothetical protein
MSEFRDYERISPFSESFSIMTELLHYDKIVLLRNVFGWGVRCSILTFASVIHPERILM